MKKRLLHLMALSMYAFTLHAQVASVNTNQVPNLDSPTSSNIGAAKTAVTATNETPEEARKQLMRVYNLYKEYSVSVDSVSLYFDMKAVEQTMNQPNATDKNSDTKSFAEFIATTDKMLMQKMEKMDNDTISNFAQLPEKSRLLRGQNILNSAKCLEGRQEGKFIRSKDADNYDIICFALDSLKRNPRYGSIDNYKEGFARIKKDQVFGFLNYCGDEIITCQYELADNFNNGKALVKKDTFVTLVMIQKVTLG